MSDLQIRRANVSDRAELLDVLNAVFGGAQKRAFDFARSHPYLFHDARVPDHTIALDAGRIVGCVGAYPYPMRIGGETFRTAGIGQVATLPEARGRGVMTALLQTVCRELDGGGFDLAWLGGDRQRYGRFGWAVGGSTMRFEFFERYLPAAPDEAGARPLDWAKDFGRLRDHVTALPDALVMPDEELLMLATGQPLTGWALGESFVVTSRGAGTVQFADGRPDEIALLLAHLLRLERRKPGDRRQVSVHCAAAPSPLLQTCLEHYGYMTSGPTWMWRACSLRPMLEKVCRAGAGRVACGSGELGLANTQTGEAATLVCRRGRFSVRDGAGEGAHRLTTTQLSEVCFGVFPPEMLLPGLPADSPFRRLLPLRHHLCQSFAL